jgi:hypothetical protein
MSSGPILMREMALNRSVRIVLASSARPPPPLRRRDRQFSPRPSSTQWTSRRENRGGALILAILLTVRHCLPGLDPRGIANSPRTNSSGALVLASLFSLILLFFVRPSDLRIVQILIGPALAELGAIIDAPDSVRGDWSSPENEKAWRRIAISV